MNASPDIRTNPNPNPINMSRNSGFMVHPDRAELEQIPGQLEIPKFPAADGQLVCRTVPTHFTPLGPQAVETAHSGASKRTTSVLARSGIAACTASPISAWVPTTVTSKSWSEMRRCTAAFA